MTSPAPVTAAFPPAPPAAALHPWLWPVAVANLVMQVLIVVTGGLVRLTGSGLGCPTWPQCEPGSYTPSFESSAGFHPYVEFGNRLLGVLVGVVAVVTVVAVWRWARGRRDLLVPALVVLVGTGFQGALGGVTVRAGLHPLTVMAHFLVSMALIAVSTVLLHRVRPGAVPAVPPPPVVRALAWLTAAVLGVVLVLGTVVTGSGPHSGDADEPARFGFDPRTASWLHADAVMLFTGLVVAMVVATHLVATVSRARETWRAVLLLTLAQGLLGYTQYLTGLPEVLVALHMLGAAGLTIAVTLGILLLGPPRAAQPASPGSPT